MTYMYDRRNLSPSMVEDDAHVELSDFSHSFVSQIMKACPYFAQAEMHDPVSGQLGVALWAMKELLLGLELKYEDWYPIHQLIVAKDPRFFRLPDLKRNGRKGSLTPFIVTTSLQEVMMECWPDKAEDAIADFMEMFE